MKVARFPLVSALVLVALLVSRAEAGVTFHASYRESASRFQILDCVSEWWDNCQDDGEYRKEWINRYGALSQEDLNFFQEYKNLRNRYLVSINEPNDPNLRKDGFFSRGSSAQEDPFQLIFYSARDQYDAYSKLANLISPDERTWLKKFYAHFEPRVSLLLEESKTPFENWATRLNGELSNPAYSTFFDKIQSFYNVSADINYELLVTWWPPIRRSMASPTDRYLVFQKNPILHMTESDLDIVFHEVVHTISAKQPLQQKKAMTKAFLDICPMQDRLKRLRILEEPLAVALGQIAFLDEFAPATLHFEDSFYNNPWISVFGKTIYPTLKAELQSGHTITQGFIEKAAKQCLELSGMARTLQAQNP